MITSNKNPEIKYVRSLEQKKYREREKVFILEGIRIVEDALADHAELIQIFHAPQLANNPRGMELLTQLRMRGIKEVPVDEKIFAEIAETEAPQGLLAVVRQPQYGVQDLFSRESLYPHIIMLNSIQDPGNLGTILRTAAGAGWAGAILTPGTVDLYNPKSLRATMGAIFKFPICRVAADEMLWVSLRDAGYQVMVADLSGDKWHFEVDFRRPTVVVVGNEGNGVEADIVQVADEKVKIPMAPNAESLNVAIAAGVLIFEGVRQNLVSVL